MTRPAAVLIGGPPATGKSTLAAALAPHLGAAILDLDVATGPLTRAISELIGVRDLHDPVLAGLTRDARYGTLLGLADANLRVGRPVILVAPFSTERAQPCAWAATARRIAAEPTMVVERMLRRRVAGLLLSPAGDAHAWLDTRRAPRQPRYSAPPRGRRWAWCRPCTPPGGRISPSSHSATSPWRTPFVPRSPWWTIPAMKSGAWPRPGSWRGWPGPVFPSSASRSQPGSSNAGPES